MHRLQHCVALATPKHPHRHSQHYCTTKTLRMIIFITCVSSRHMSILWPKFSFHPIIPSPRTRHYFFNPSATLLSFQKRCETKSATVIAVRALASVTPVLTNFARFTLYVRPGRHTLTHEISPFASRRTNSSEPSTESLRLEHRNPPASTITSCDKIY